MFHSHKCQVKIKSEGSKNCFLNNKNWWEIEENISEHKSKIKGKGL